MENLANIQVIQNIVYIVSSVMFILGIKMLGKEATAVKGNYLSALAMFSAVGITCLSLEIDLKSCLLFLGELQIFDLLYLEILRQQYAFNLI